MIKSFKDYPEWVYSGFFIRFCAFLIDLMMIGSLQRMTLFYISAGALRTFLTLVIYLLYFILTTKLNDGQTLGKTILGIKVICLSEEELTWKSVIVRECFGRYLQKAIPILYILTIFTTYKQHLVDLLSDTSVVTLNSLYILEDIEARQMNFASNEIVSE